MLASPTRPPYELAFACFLAFGLGTATAAQELTPRAYAPNPTGGNLVLLAYGHSSGEVLFDPSLPFDDVHADINSGALLYARTFGLWGRSAVIAAVQPYIWGEIDGLVLGERQAITRSGLGDPRAQLTVNVLGGPALPPAQFARHRTARILGLSVAVAVPSGQYDPAKLVNIGSNRWALKSELGFSQTVGAWYLELYGGVWAFGANEDFYGGARREQDPLATFQAHLGYTFRPRLWLAGDATYYAGGRTSVDGGAKDDPQANSRLGLTLALPVGRRSALKFSLASGFTTRVGADFQSVGIAFQTIWFR